MARHCAICGKALSFKTTGQLCLAHYRADPEINRRRGQAISRTRMAHVAADSVDDYRTLRRKVGADEAMRIITEHRQSRGEAPKP